ncbi:hypothetical protein AB1K70_26230 [Bremerella sp. JC770]|uniref:hypothetical protein n=1 Tax=Bremerella sp. JC770 TaxID=3232137 RepID=UPI00345920A4
MMEKTRFPRPQLWQYVTALVAMGAALVGAGILLQMLSSLYGADVLVAIGFQCFALWYCFAQYAAVFRSHHDATCLALGVSVLTFLAATLGVVVAPLVEFPTWAEISPSNGWKLWLPIKLWLPTIGVSVLSLAAMLANYQWMKTLEAAGLKNFEPPVRSRETLMGIMLKILAISIVLGAWSGARMWN